MTPLGFALRRPALAWLWLLPAIAASAAIFADHALRASLLINDERWFWLDDDQMISMRYARNLAEGFGPVWNPGERVEGYTNPGWMLVMAAVHRLPLPDRLMPLAMLAVAGAFLVTVLVLAGRLLARIEPNRLMLTLPALFALIVTCTDVMFWASSGFETVLVTALHLAVVLQAVGRKPPGVGLLIPLALLPVIRSDGLYVWLGDAALVLWLAADRRRAGLLVLLSLVPFAGHVLFRLGYYGELLPNTYYLKVAGLDSRPARGLSYLLDFARHYWLALLLAFVTVVHSWRRDPRTRSALTSFAPAFVYPLLVGGDDFGNARFLAYVMPELFLWAVLAAVRLPLVSSAGAVVLAAFVLVSVPPLRAIAPPGANGDPASAMVVAANLRKNASPDASVAVIAAGIVPYFTRLPSVDLLGKNDAHIAHMPPLAGAMVGHGKLDPAYSFGKHPDYVVSHRPLFFAERLASIPPSGGVDYVRMILESPEFRRDWLPNPVPNDDLLNGNALYVFSGSPEMAKLPTWTGVNSGEQDPGWFAAPNSEP